MVTVVVVVVPVVPRPLDSSHRLVRVLAVLCIGWTFVLCVPLTVCQVALTNLFIRSVSRKRQPCVILDIGKTRQVHQKIKISLIESTNIYDGNCRLSVEH